MSRSGPSPFGPLLPTSFLLSCGAGCGRGRARYAPRGLSQWLGFGAARVLQDASAFGVPISWRALAGLFMTGRNPKSTSQRPARSLPSFKLLRLGVLRLIAGPYLRQHPSRRHSHGAACLPESAAPLPRRGHRGHKSIRAQVEGRCRRGPRRLQAHPQIGQQLCANQIPARSSSTPSTRRLLDGVAMAVPHRSTEPARPCHRREMTW